MNHAFAALLLLLQIGSSAAVVRIGFPVALTGPNATAGVTMANAASLWSDMVNGAG
jgi:ABC-type branched-subunit amino acid transport system substrate-binding protein